MSYRRETATRYYYSWVGHNTKREAEKEAREYRKEGKKCVVSKYGDNWHVWRWHSKKAK